MLQKPKNEVSEIKFVVSSIYSRIYISFPFHKIAIWHFDLFLENKLEKKNAAKCMMKNYE